MNNLRDWPVASIASIIIRGLPGNTTEREVKSLLLFTKDLLQSGLRTQSPNEESIKQVSAWATFTSQEAALQAKNALDGKAMGQGFLTVELDKGAMPIGAPIGSPPGTRPPIGTRRNTTDGGPIANQGAKYSQYPPGVDFSSPSPLDSASSYAEQLYSSPQSPIQYGEPGNLSYMIDPVNTKALINQDNSSDIEAAISNNLYLQDPLQSPLPLIANSKPRRATNPQPGISQFGISAYGLGSGGLGLAATAPLSAPLPSTALGGSNVVSPIGPPPPNHSNFLYRQNRMLPAVNPSDQNPPCNTLYVGNLPVGTSEDELKALFSRQRGYKRLCFRTKANGPMCFVEFEDIGFATKALTELYGHNLSNSVKGGIRLSFSKNPLGVRSPAPGAAGAPNAQQSSSQTYPQSYSSSSAAFATAQHAPPGLIHPAAQNNMALYVGR